MLATIAINIPEVADAASSPAYSYTKDFDTTNGNVVSIATATDRNGGVYVTGFFAGTVIFGPGGSDIVNAGNNSNVSAFITKYGPGGVYDWTKTFDASAVGSLAVAHSIATDSSGNVYASGYFGGAVVFDGPGGSDSHNFPNNASFLTKFNADGSYGWTKVTDTTNGDTMANAVATDASGNVFVGGASEGLITFDGPGGTDSQSSPNMTGYLTKYNANGSYGWTKEFNTSAGSAGVLAIATDTSGDIYAAGNFQGTTDFDSLGGTGSESSANGSLFVTKLGAGGGYDWTKISDTTAGGSNSLASGVAVDTTGSVYVTGSFNGTVMFDGAGHTDSKTSANSSAFLTKFGASGTYGWTKYFDTSQGSDYGGGVAVDPAGGVYLLTGIDATVTFDGPGGTDTVTSPPGNFDGAITKYASDGSYMWTKAFDTTNGDAVYGDGNTYGIATDTLGNLYATGYFTGTVAFDGFGGTDLLTAESGNVDSFLTSYLAFVPPPVAASHTPVVIGGSGKAVKVFIGATGDLDQTLMAIVSGLPPEVAYASPDATPGKGDAAAPTPPSRFLQAKAVVIILVLAVIALVGYARLKRRPAGLNRT